MQAPTLLSYGFSHHLFHQAAGLTERWGEAFRTVTPTYFDPATVERVQRWLPRVARRLAGRSHPGLPGRQVRTYPSEHLRQILAGALHRPFSFYAAHDRMARRIVRDFAPPRCVIAIDTGAESLFRAWAGRSIRILDLTIATPQYRSSIFRAAEADPAHGGVSFHHPGPWEFSRYDYEVKHADHILCPSEFVRDSCRFLGVAAEKLHVLPYGFDPARFTPETRSPPDDISPESPLRIVFAGTFGHRKGSHLLLPAFARLRAEFPRSELHIFGEILDAPRQSVEGTVFHGRLPQEQFARALRTMHLMAFPTLFEGSAYVVYQALASGVPVITTPNCGSIVDERCGRILPAITTEALTDALLEMARNRPAWRQRALAAPGVAAQYSWSAYHERLAGFLSPLLATTNTPASSSS